MANEFLPFGLAPNANVLGQEQYAILPARSEGFVGGVASSEQFNKVWRQSSFMTAAIGEFVSDKLNTDVLDNGDLEALVAQLNVAMSGFPDVAQDNILYARRNQDWTNLDNILAAYATRQYVNDVLTAFDTGELSMLLAHYVFRAGDSMTGFLTLHADPTAPYHAASRHYVDQSISTIQLQPGPAGPPGQPGQDGAAGPPGESGSPGAPGLAGQGVANYSTNEVTGNQQWIDGRLIYQRTFQPTTLHGSFAHGITHLGTVVRFEGWARNPATGSWLMLPHAHGSDEDNQGDDESNSSIGLAVTPTQIVISSTGEAKHSAFTQIWVTLFYTRTDR